MQTEFLFIFDFFFCLVNRQIERSTRVPGSASTQILWKTENRFWGQHKKPRSRSVRYSPCANCEFAFLNILCEKFSIAVRAGQRGTQQFKNVATTKILGMGNWDFSLCCGGRLGEAIRILFVSSRWGGLDLDVVGCPLCVGFGFFSWLREENFPIFSFPNFSFNQQEPVVRSLSDWDE